MAFATADVSSSGVTPGRYNVQVTNMIREANKNSPGSALHVQFKVMDGPAVGRTIHERFNLDNQNSQAVDIAEKQIMQMAMAGGVTEAECRSWDTYKQDPNWMAFQRVLGAQMTITMGQQKDKPEYTEIKGYYPLEAPQMAYGHQQGQQPGGFQQPQPQYQQPAPGGFQQPAQQGSVQQPFQPGGYAPQGGQQPQYQQPAPGGFQQPAPGGFQQPAQQGGFQPQQGGQPPAPQYQQPAPGGFQQPAPGGFQQPQPQPQGGFPQPDPQQQQPQNPPSFLAPGR
jgi:hypothetical protein